jgi:hypothetical protein
MDAAVGYRVGLLCEQLSTWATLRDIIRADGAEPKLEALMTLLGAEAEPDQARVAALIDAVEEACARQQLPGLARRTTQPGGVPALPPGMAGRSASAIAGWTCPVGRCDRVVTPDETSTAPACAVVSGAGGGTDGSMKPCLLPPR